MILTVCRVERIEMIRDGGSLAAIFENESAARFILFLPIHIATTGGKREHVGYHQPILIDCDPIKRPRNTDRVIYSELGGPQVQVSWTEARIMIETIAHLAGERSPQEAQWLDEMTHVIANSGSLSPNSRSCAG